ncbi:sigma-70 family RNA polymerase sigma factor [Bacillus sp. ISL-35]|uniref:sigma-70 family RNA polymerase sigma factor n=1 Tax=Bacillus sp. ISL-35 TaxID=2819122 RepID=UPI001BEC9CD6|nr:sigma-70 family RNA polymerase sigma factor [Bacillus sp. ISL-35]MBT2678527.1 sigma-70 family RNA polymerase sigma factor [Bacillus sp. ISL-35]MBT2705832.1 sigma-70 family RNA polymerase sigma factor [Chryseobacterium sp. ISL-80]
MDTVFLVRKAQKGSDEAFEELLSGVRDKLYRTAYSYVRNEHDALDIYQDAIYKAYTSLKSLKNPQSFESWIVKLLVFRAIDFIRRESRHFPADNIESFEHAFLNDTSHYTDQSIDLFKAFDYLDPNYKTIILLRYYHDLSVKEIARMLDCPEGTVKSCLHRAKKELRPILKEGYSYE